jgi:hypothetical protein
MGQPEMHFICLKCVDHQLQILDPKDPDRLGCPKCAWTYSAADLAAKEREALRRLPEYTTYGVPELIKGTTSESHYVPHMILEAIEESKRIVRAQSAHGESARKTKMGRVSDPGVMHTLSEQISKRDQLITARGLSGVPAPVMREALFLYRRHLLDCGLIEDV